MTNRSAGRRRSSVAFSRVHAAIYRLSGGRLGREFFGAPVVVLETVGRSSGQLRRTPVIGLRSGVDVVVLAANAGAPRDPQWWLNLRAAGRTKVIQGDAGRNYHPRVATGPERSRLWKQFVELYPPTAHYPQFTDRELPLVVLEPEPDTRRNDEHHDHTPD